MSTISSERVRAIVEGGVPTTDAKPTASEARRESASTNRWLARLLAAVRVSIGWVFLWAFLDKLFGLGHETPSAKAWVHGGSPTAGFLKNTPEGPLASFYRDIAGAGWADWLFMLGLLGVGVALILGIGMRIAAGAGALLLLMMWSAVLPPANNPFMDEHIIYALTLGVLALTSAGRSYGFGVVWERMPLVRRFPFLK